MRGVLLAAIAALFGCGPDTHEQLVAAALPTQIEAASTAYFIDGATIPRISCNTERPDWFTTGSGIRISSAVLATANHVVDHPSCRVDGETPVLVIRYPKLDFALVFTHPVTIKSRWTCARPKKGDLFFVSGYAESSYRHRTMPLVATGDTRNGEAVFIGDTGHGASGGPVSDIDGRVYGVVLAKVLDRNNKLLDPPLLTVRLFADTALCKKAGPALGGRKAGPAK